MFVYEVLLDLLVLLINQMKEILLWSKICQRLLSSLRIEDPIETATESAFEGFLESETQKFWKNLGEMLSFGDHFDLAMWDI